MARRGCGRGHPVLPVDLVLDDDGGGRAAAPAPSAGSSCTRHSLEYSRTLVERAEAAAIAPIVLTVDLPVLGGRERDRRSGFALPADAPHGDGGPGEPHRYGGGLAAARRGLTWDSIAAIRTWTSLPLVLKGILSPADARGVEPGSRESWCRTTAAASSIAR